MIGDLFSTWVVIDLSGGPMAHHVKFCFCSQAPCGDKENIACIYGNKSHGNYR